MEINRKYSNIKKEYNSNKTFVQIDKELHMKMKKYCKERNIKVKDFLAKIIEDIIINSIILIAIFSLSDSYLRCI